MAMLRVHIFLSGLDSEFNQVYGETLRKDPKLDLENTYTYVRREYQQRQTMGSYHPIYENLALLTNTPQQGSSYELASKRNTQLSRKVNNLVYAHYAEKGHSQQWCYEIIGYPEWWDFSKKPQKKISTRAMTTSTEDQQQPITNFAHLGRVGKVYVFPTHYKDKTWIVDTGASEHMTIDVRQLQSILPSSQSVISTGNGSTSPVTREGYVILSNTLTLNTILVVPSLEYNLLSVSQITSTLHCTITFWPSFCVFQNILTQRILGYGVRRGKLYYLELTDNGE